MPDPRPGDFALVSVHGRVGVLISFGEWLDGDGFSHFDHAEVYVGQPDDAGPYGYTVSAYPDGDGRKPLPCPAADLPGALWSTGIIALTQDDRDAIVAWCLANEHVRYGWLDYLALAAHRLRLPVPGLRRYIGRSGRMICSQLTDYAYGQAGVYLFTDGRWPGFCTPADLARCLEEMRAT